MTRDLKWNAIVTPDFIISRSEVSPYTECWVWTGSRSEDGYARYGKNNAANVARISWEHKNGCVMPLDRMACHTCDNPPCVNPSHIYAGTSSNNIKDTWDRTRIAPARVTQKLTNEEVAKIKADRVTSARQLAKNFGVSHATINKIRTGKRFTDIEAAQ